MRASALPHSALFIVQFSHLYMTTGKSIALSIWTFVEQVMSLLFNILSRVVIAFLKGQVSFNFIAAVTVCGDFGVQENKICHCFHFFSLSLPWNDGTRCHDLTFLQKSFKPAFSLSSFTFIKRLFSFSLSAIRVVSSVYLRLLIFLLEILTPACASSSLAFRIMYSTCKWNKQGDNLQPWHTRFPIWNQSVVPCPVLTVASWPAYRFLRRQGKWSGIPISLRIFHSLLWSTQML